MQIGPLIRKLVFRGAHTIFWSLSPNRGPNIDFRPKCTEEKFFASLRQKE